MEIFGLGFKIDSINRVGDKLKDKEPQPFDFSKDKALESIKWVLSRD